MRQLKTTAGFLSLMFLAACGGSGGGSDMTSDESTGNEESSGVTVVEDLFGQDGNLYKPSADPKGAGAGNVVVLLSTKYSTQFDSCEVVLNTGETRQLLCINNVPWTHIPYSCFGNKGRQTWRADFTCSAMSEVKVTCRDTTREVIFKSPAGREGEICSRF